MHGQNQAIASALGMDGSCSNNSSQEAPLAVLQAVDGIALKIAVDTWYAIPTSPSTSADGSEGEKAIAFRVAEGIRWTEIASQ